MTVKVKCCGHSTSVPILKFLFTLGLHIERSAAEAFNGCQDRVGGLGPSEGLGFCIPGVDVGHDVVFQFFGRPVCAPSDLLLGKQAKEAFDLVDP